MPFIEIKGRRIETTVSQDTHFTRCVSELRNAGLPGDEARLRCAIRLGLWKAEPPSEVVLPESGQEALYALMEEPTGKEWGGGIDFELVSGKPQVERLLAYLGEEGKVPWQVIQKYGKDVEVEFHTHPDRERPGASKSDISYFINGPHQVELIVARNEILIMEKTPETPSRMTVAEIEAKTPQLGYYEPELAEQRASEMAEAYNMKVTLVPRYKRVTFDLDVVRRISTETGET